MRGRVPAFERDALEALERRVAHALASRYGTGPEVLGYGEISCVLALRFDGGGVACKRLPPFGCEEAFEAYRSCLDTQLEAFANHGVPVLATELHRVEDIDTIIAYCVQPLVEPHSLVPARLRREPPGKGTELVETILERALAYVAPTRGLDGQLSNWAIANGELVYLDVSTPLLRDDEGRERLDVDIFLASLPWLLRGVVKRFVLRSILDPYYSPRGVTLDLLGNVIKEGLADLLPELTAIAGRRLGDPLTVEQVRRHYARDARTWHLLQRLRQFDRAWQWHVRGRPYSILLPGPVERRV